MKALYKPAAAAGLELVERPEPSAFVEALLGSDS